MYEYFCRISRRVTEMHRDKRNMSSRCLVLLVHCCLVQSWQQQRQVVSSSRRDVLIRLGNAGHLGGIVLSGPLESAHAARGSAELDLEYYVRGIFGGTWQEGNILPSTPPAVVPPRVIREPLLSALFNDDFGPTAIPVEILAQTVAQRSGRSKQDVVQAIQERATSIREKASRSFLAQAPWQHATVSDQYYFNLSAYALWKTAAELLPSNYVDRDVFVRNTGRALYRQMIADGLVDVPSTSTSKGNNAHSVVAALPGVQQVLDAFCQCNYCQAYLLGPDEPSNSFSSKNGSKNNNNNNKKRKTDEPPVVVVDEFDDEALTSGGNVDFLVRVLEPATLGAALQITGEQSRFAPDLIGPTLAAHWETAAGLSSITWECYFVDPVYRPNPKDYFPTEQLLQYTLRI